MTIQMNQIIQTNYPRFLSKLLMQSRKFIRSHFVLRRHLNKLRWLVLTLVFAILILLPLLHLYQTYLAAYAYDLFDADKKMFFQTMESLTAPFTDNPVDDLDSVKGTTWRGTFFGLRSEERRVGRECRYRGWTNQ